jgi:hypothetical protein
LRDPGWNLMGWNLASHELSWTGARYLVDGLPLRFFHFCGGFDPHDPTLLTRRSDLPWSRQRVEGPTRGLAEKYADRLLSAGYDQQMASPNGYSRLVDGSAVDSVMRFVYRHALIASENDGSAEPPNPFFPGEEWAFLAWLSESCDPDEPLLSRYLYGLWAGRADLQAVFPHLPGADTARYLDWVRGEPANATAIPARFQPAQS